MWAATLPGHSFKDCGRRLSDLQTRTSPVILKLWILASHRALRHDVLRHRNPKAYSVGPTLATSEASVSKHLKPYATGWKKLLLEAVLRLPPTQAASEVRRYTSQKPFRSGYFQGS